MTRGSLGFLAATAAFAVFGGLHLEIASGRALDRVAPDDARLDTGRTFAATTVNRSTKADRQRLSLGAAEGRTITFQHPDHPATTIAVRLWETVGMSSKGSPAAKQRKSPASKPKQAVACESVVSALTEVAKHLEAGRCVT